MIFNMVGGGGGSSTKSTIIVSIDTGSTVAAYSDSSYQTLVKTASEKTTGEYWLTGLDNGTYYIKATKGSDEDTLAYTISEYGVYRVSMVYRDIPDFTYSGTYEIVQDDDTTIQDADTYKGDWKIRFLTSGTLIFSKLRSAVNGIDVFLVGGGGAGSDHGTTGNGGGGGGGHTSTATDIVVSQDTEYSIIVGDGGLRAENASGKNGGDSSAFEVVAIGGNGATKGSNYNDNGANGGSGGGYGDGNSAPQSYGGADGSKGYGSNGGTGQGTTTREFGGYINSVASSVSSSSTFVLATSPTSVEQAFLSSGNYVTFGTDFLTYGNVHPISAFNSGTNTVTLTESVTVTSGTQVTFGRLYAGGGSGGANYNTRGGYGGGGQGGSDSQNATAGQANTGGGGGAMHANKNSQNGGSGIVIIRNARA